jgi:hypothetical protein
MAYTAESLGFIGKRAEHPRWQLPDVSLEDIQPDRGCVVAPSCLTCWLPQCILDYPPQERTMVRRQFLEKKRQKPSL